MTTDEAGGPSAAPEVTVGVEREFVGKRIKVRLDRVRLADGTETLRDVVLHPNAVVIVALDDEGNVLLVRQYRKALERELLELPAGVIEGDDEPLPSAQRELREETGYSAGSLKPLGYFFAAPGSMTECLYSFLARDLTYDPLPADHDERIDLLRVPFAEAIAMARRGDLNDAKTLASLLLAEGLL